MADDTPPLNLLKLAADLTVAWLANPNTRADLGEVGQALVTIHTAITALGTGAATTEAETAQAVPAATVRRSLASPDHIISMIDGKPYKLLRRHLTTHGLTPDEYRQRFGLKKDYPMVAPSYASARSAMAKAIGLGLKSGETRKSSEPSKDSPSSAPAKRRERPPKSV